MTTSRHSISVRRSKGAPSDSTTEPEQSISRRKFLEAAGAAGVGLATFKVPEQILRSSRPDRAGNARYSMDYVRGDALCPFAHMRLTAGWE
jgi:hypothetical protein